MTEFSAASTAPDVTTLPCARCRQLTTWQGNPYRPFCSERCKLIDLGAWASEDYRIATAEQPSRITPQADQD